MADTLRVGARLQVQQDRATIRFLGTIPGTKGEWLGVEWDDPSRGKHDGSHQGTSYFECSSPTAGSFIRYHPEKVVLGRTFLDALKDKYVDDSTGDDGELYLGSNKQIKVEMVGFDKVRREQSEIGHLHVVGLEGCAVASAGPKEAIAEANLHIRELDLGSNLINSWETVADIVSQLPDLKKLRLGNNRLGPPPLSDTRADKQSPFERLGSLALHATLMTFDDVLALAPLVPHLQELQLAGNQIQSISRFSGAFEHLISLRLDDNKLDSWESVARLGCLPSLETLCLNGNQICKIYAPEPNTFVKLTYLRIRNNAIDDWSSFDALDKYPSLTHIQCDGNPLLKDSEIDFNMAHIVGRSSKLRVINGAMLVGRERNDYERYYLKICIADGNTHHDIGKLHPRYEALCQAHGTPDLGVDSISKTSAPTLNDRLIDITLSIRAGLTEEALMQATTADMLPPAVKKVEKRILATMRIRNVRQVIQKLLKIPASDQQLFLIQDIAPGECLLCVKLDDDLRNLGYYGMTTGAEIVVL